MKHIDKEWEVYEHLEKQKDEIKEQARILVNEQERRYQSEVS